VKRSLPCWPLATLAVLPCATLAAGMPTLDQTVVINGQAIQGLVGAADSAGEGTVTARQLANRPLLRPAEVMEAVPGLTVTQHSGDGKANQYFLRGFNLDHGSDFSTQLMGMPVNMASHAHGQGYMDLNFLIPELVAALRYRKGPYAAEDGDFATTGSARIDYQRALPTRFADVTLGEHGHRRVLGAGSGALGERTLLGAVEAVANDGPWDQPERVRKLNAVLRLSSGTRDNGQALSLLAYRAEWTATEHVPERAIERGEIGRFGTLSPTDGGITHRHSLSAEWARSGEAGRAQANAYVIRYGLNLFSNPSGMINGPQGDQHEQADRRTVWGGEVSGTRFLGPAWRDTDLTLGLQWRQDRIGTLGLYDTVARMRTGTVREDAVRESALGLYGQARTAWTPWLRSLAGLRWDAVQARVTPRAGNFDSANGGSAHDDLLSPKLALVIGPFGGTEFYANWGRGFHSNDARGATATQNPRDGSPVDPVRLQARAQGAELGLRAAPLPGWNTSLSLWRMALASELVFIGDEGVTEPRGSSHRVGLEWSVYGEPARGVIVDADVAWTRARFDQAANGGTHVPNAIPLSVSMGLAYDRQGRWFGGLRWRYIGAYSLEESGTQRSAGAWTASLKLGRRIGAALEASVEVLNLFDRRANDIEYWGAACTPADGPGCNGSNGIDGRLLHPMEPRTLRLSLRLRF